MHSPHVPLLPLSLLLFSAVPALAQTYTSCDPTKKSCPANAALSSSTYTHDFTTGADEKNWKVSAGSISYTSSGAEFTINKAGDSPTIQSNWYIFFGSVSFLVRTAPGKGVVSSAILQSDVLDEVDWEWLGGEAGNVQTNYFGKGNTTTHDRQGNAAVANTQGTTHNYTIQWTKSQTSWIIDNVVVRTLKFADANGAAGTGSNYPQTPMNVRVGIWAGGDPNNAKGTIEWAGGETDYSQAPFTMVLEKIEVRNENPGSSYEYGDRSGQFGSIVVNKDGSGKKDEGKDDDKDHKHDGKDQNKHDGKDQNKDDDKDQDKEGDKVSSSASASPTVNVQGGAGGEWAMGTNKSTATATGAYPTSGANSTRAANSTGTVNSKGPSATENTAESGAVMSKVFGASYLALLGCIVAMLLL